jgi:hypothetical protein
MKCIKCGNVIPEARVKALPNVRTCINHSDAEKKVGTPIMLGTGEDTYVELNIMEAEDYKRFEKMKHTTRNLAG